MHVLGGACLLYQARNWEPHYQASLLLLTVVVRNCIDYNRMLRGCRLVILIGEFEESYEPTTSGGPVTPDSL